MTRTAQRPAGRPRPADSRVGGAPVRELPRRRRSWPWKSIIASAVALAVLGGVAWAVLGTSLVGVRSVRVTGVGRLSVGQVLDAAAVPPGHPMATLDTTAIAQRVSRVPAVARVRVARSWPHTVRILVTERVPFAARRDASGGGVRLVDRSGVAFWPSPNPPVLPLLDVPVGAPAELTRAGLDVLAALPRDLRDRVMSVQVPSPNGVQLTLRSGKVVRWGDAGDPARKALALRAVLHQHGHLYDVSTPTVVTIR